MVSPVRMNGGNEKAPADVRTPPLLTERAQMSYHANDTDWAESCDAVGPKFVPGFANVIGWGDFYVTQDRIGRTGNV